jgi:aminoglycoside phosphotransferase (APT) family kinase protein
VDTERIAQYLRTHGDFSAIQRVVPIAGGQSNLTFILELADRNVVLRRPPEGPLPPSAHDVLREYRVLQGLDRSSVPVPEPLLACDDLSVMGVPFYVMEYVPGVTIRYELPAAYASAPDAERQRLAFELIDTLALLHQVVPDTVGLGDLGRPSGYMARQLRRWNGQLEYARTRATPDIDWLSTWLGEHLPAEDGPVAIVHGDYRLDNALFSAVPPAELLAVVDWELSTLGDPLADLGYLLAAWREPGDPPPEIHTFSRVTELQGFPSRAEVADRYATAVGRAIPNLTFYEVFSIWKMTIFFEGHFARHVRGTSGEFDFSHLEWGVPNMAARGHRIAEAAQR